MRKEEKNEKIKKTEFEVLYSSLFSD